MSTGIPGRLARFRSGRLYGPFVYLAVGGAAFVVDLGLLIVGRDLLGWPLAAASATSFWAGLVVSYVMQRFLTFRDQRSDWHSLWKYGVLVAVNSLATVLVIELFDRIGLGYIVGKFVSTALTTLWNYAAYRFWVFADRSGDAAGVGASGDAGDADDPRPSDPAAG
ncbi:GtrA family protein [Clavibacter nebraskensis]|uniref:Conserved membrane protein n=1 Tax=Clavibacter nebraskensis NCPPB 2581 TaxID=1097677 RepID=A0AAI9EL42_9MICO|nr:GtrA family protein [Clavibacter nebraskensis]QGV67364.1 GtrA family protein [Clavibacter nebraskensis]UKF29041.1 GtrA family protein [Clavibacter nebraskensis]UQB07252.1 GtrA family protein [Clavibacter nebraskensis]UQB12917.1 GtrA family protein [Clavibacter nebraskensis]UQB15753.1 GtrA family protein [Clavibacter nebraskensis]